jgi:hypothetical protein
VIEPVKLLFSEVTDDLRTRHHFCNLLTTSWLRPERALLDAYMVSVIEPFTKNLSGNSLDWGCTDASLSFAILGGVFKFEYDDYLEVEWLSKLNDVKIGLNVDFFDKTSSLSIDPVLKSSGRKFTHGLSWKESHVLKAERFKIHDLLSFQEFERKLPYADNFFNFILATNLFWIEGEKVLKNVLADLNAKSKLGAKVLTIFPQKSAPLTIAQQLEGADKEWVKKIDRGISANLLMNAMTLEEFTVLFESTGFKITNVVEFCPALISTIYQIGFRPMFPVFLSMYEKIKKVSPEKLMEIKEQWINTVSDFMLPLCDSEWMSKTGMQNTWYFFELETI